MEWKGDSTWEWRAGGRARAGGTGPRRFYSALPRHRSAFPVVAMLSTHHATMHGTAQAFHRVMAIGAAKSVSFEGGETVLDLKLV